MSKIGDIFLGLFVDDKKFQADIIKAGDKAGQSLAGRLKSALSPARIGAALGAAFGAVGVAAAKMGGQVDAAFDTIRVGTGATGDALRGLEGDFKAVAGSVRDDLGTTAEVIADLNTRTGQTGEGLQGLAKNILDLSRITKTDAVANVAAATRLFGDWSIATEDQSDALDKLFRTSQATGVGVTDLMETVVQFGAPMRLLGLSFEESIAMLGKWEKEGVNVETALAGLKFGVKTLAREGVKAADMGEAFRRKLDAIKKSADPVGESIKIFGLRAGPNLAAAILEGRFATDDLLAIINDTSETIASATADTEDFGDTLAKVFNRARVEFGDAFSFLGSIGQTLGPLLYILPALTTAFGKLAGSIVGKAGPALAGFFQDISLGKQTGLAGAVNRSGAFLGGLFAKAFAGAQIIGGALASTLMKIPGMAMIRGAAVAAGAKVGIFMGTSLGRAAALAIPAALALGLAAVADDIEAELDKVASQIRKSVFGEKGPLDDLGAAVNDLPWPLGPKNTPDINIGPFEHILGGDSSKTSSTPVPRSGISAFAEGGFLPTGRTGWVGETGIEQIKSIPGGTIITPLQNGAAPSTTNLNLTFTGRIGDEKEDVVSALQRAATFVR